MEKERVWVRFGVAAIICVLAGNLIGPFGKLLSNPEVASLLIYLETGRVVKMELVPPAETVIPDTEPATDPVPTETTQPEKMQAVFREEDAELVQVYYHWEPAGMGPDGYRSQGADRSLPRHGKLFPNSGRSL